MRLPIQPPLEPMLAKLARSIPDGDGWLFEPKWDGFRCVVFRDGDRLELISRKLRPLGRYFPELLGPLREALPERCIVDGEIVVADAGGRGLDFDALLQRIHPAESRINRLAADQHTSSRRLVGPAESMPRSSIRSSASVTPSCPPKRTTAKGTNKSAPSG